MPASMMGWVMLKASVRGVLICCAEAILVSYDCGRYRGSNVAEEEGVAARRNKMRGKYKATIFVVLACCAPVSCLTDVGVPTLLFKHRRGC